MRFALALAAVLLASPCFAATITTQSHTSTHLHDMSGVTSIDGWVQLAGEGGYRWTIPELDIADEGMTYTLTEANAASYGFDWAVANTFIQQSVLMQFTFSVGSIINEEERHVSRVLDGPKSFLQAELIDLQFRLIAWDPQGVRVLGRVTYGVPEPSCAAIASLSACFLVMAYRSRRPLC